MFANRKTFRDISFLLLEQLVLYENYDVLWLSHKTEIDHVLNNFVKNRL